MTISIKERQQIEQQHQFWFRTLLELDKIYLAQTSTAGEQKIPGTSEEAKVAMAVVNQWVKISVTNWIDNLLAVGYLPRVFTLNEIVRKQIPDFVLATMWRAFPVGYAPPDLFDYCQNRFGARPYVPTYDQITGLPVSLSQNLSLYLRDVPKTTYVSITVPPQLNYALDSNGSGGLLVLSDSDVGQQIIELEFRFGSLVTEGLDGFNYSQIQNLFESPSSSTGPNAQVFANRRGLVTELELIQSRCDKLEDDGQTTNQEGTEDVSDDNSAGSGATGGDGSGGGLGFGHEQPGADEDQTTPEDETNTEGGVSGGEVTGDTEEEEEVVEDQTPPDDETNTDGGVSDGGPTDTGGAPGTEDDATESNNGGGVQGGGQSGGGGAGTGDGINEPSEELD